MQYFIQYTQLNSKNHIILYTIHSTYVIHHTENRIFIANIAQLFSPVNIFNSFSYFQDITGRHHQGGNTGNYYHSSEYYYDKFYLHRQL